MILAITRDNEKIIYEVCKENGLDAPQVITDISSLRKFAIQDAQMLNNYSCIIIDINSTKEQDEDIINAVVGIKAMYNIKIVVLAFGYKEGNVLLSKLFNEGIYNFVTGETYYEQIEQFRKCLSNEGCQYKDAIRYRQKIEETGKNKIIVKKEYKKLKQFVNIAVAGTESHIGVTTQAILITMFLKSLNMNACYICGNNKDEIKNIEKVDGVVKKDNMYSYKGIDLYSNLNKVDAMQYGYDFYVYDYGTLTENNLDNFLSKEVKIVVGGLKPWEQDETFRVLQLVGKVTDVDYIFNFANDEEKVKFKNLLKRYIKNIYYSDLVTDCFKDDVNTDIYHSIFKEYITEKSNKISVIEKKGLFNFLKGGKNEKGFIQGIFR